MSRRDLNSFRWDGTQWLAAVSTISPLKAEPESLPTRQQYVVPVFDDIIRIATFNILADCFPWFIELSIRSAERLEWLSNAITTLNPTIIGLNEVTARSLRQLQQCPFIRDHYFITEFIDEFNHCANGLLSPHGCVILSKLPIMEAFSISVSESVREAVVVKVQLAKNIDSCVYICAHHTTAYQTPKNARLRMQQIHDIISVLHPLGLAFTIMGDLNLHYKFEDAIIVDNELIDAWAQTHFSNIDPFNDENQGYTFDAIENHFIPYYIPGECRRMRLDRILFSQGFPAYALTPCALWANEPIKPDNYLFPSDHFGLFIDIVTNNLKHSNQVMPLDKPDAAANKILLKNAQNNKEQRAYSLGILRTSIALVVHIFWLGAMYLGFK